MSYIGRVEQKASDIKRLNVTGSTSATHTLTWSPPNEQSLIITINGVKQQEDAYSVSGTTLTLTSALVSTDKMEVIGIQDVGETMVPGTGTITNDHISSTAAIAQSKLSLDITNSDVNASAAIALSKLATDPSNASNLASGTVPTARLGSGTADATTFLRGDQSWATAGGDNTPAFLATSTSEQTVTNDVVTKIEFANSVFDTDSAFDNTTNYRFTVPSGEGGKYSFQVTLSAWNSNSSGMKVAEVWIRVNGSSVSEVAHDMRNNYGGSIGFGIPFLLDLSASDYVEIYGRIQATGTCKWYSSTTYRSSFSGFKLL